MKAKINPRNNRLCLTLLVLNLSMAYGQANNDITAVSPNSTMQGVTEQTISFTLDTDNPPAPPAGVMPQRVSIGSTDGSAIAHPSQYTVTAVFDIPADEPAGAKDVSIAFLTPQGHTLLFFVASGFTVIEAGELPPTITQQPRSQTVTLGSLATFTVTAWGTEPLIYQWYKDDLAISGATASSYAIQSVGQSDEGDYYCIITNDFGSVVSDIASLAITTTPPFEGYNLFSAIGSGETYLMDNDGNVVHSWSSSYGPGLSVCLLEDGTLLRTANTRDSAFDIGGAGGRVEQFNWDGDLLWSYDFSSTNYRLHHDIEMLPNGNILMIAWELKTESQAIAAGRDLSLLPDGELWPDFIIEVEPTGSNSGNIVWQWHVWDHLIQEYDPTKENYGVVADHPEKINLNYVQRGGDADWNHFNSIDYNSELDQILVSVHNFSEIWVIDHSTTTEEAAGSSGGNSGKGGDLLYRWGNPQTYNRGTSEDQQLFAQHDAEWIDSGLPGEGDILIFNNGQGRPAGNYSSVDQITPPVNPDGSYTLDADNTYGPKMPVWTFTSTPVSDFYADRISGSQRLANGNTLICEGTEGRLFEVTSDGAIVWEYNYGGEIFRVERYSPYYPGFIGTDLEPQTRYLIVDTGQVECYDASKVIAAPAPGETFYGQDAQFNGNQPSYTLSDDGLTVYDNVTGLTWTQSPDTNGDGNIDFDDKLTFTEFQTYADTLNAENYGGYSDWRAPTIKELYSLIDFRGYDQSPSATSASGPAFIDTDYFDFGYGDTTAGERIIDAQYWSTTTYVSTTMSGDATVFGVNFADGRIKGYPRDINPMVDADGNGQYDDAMTEYVRFVRGNIDYGINNFVDNGDGTVTDDATGLMWAQNDNGSGLNWEEALAWAQTQNAANYLGHNDWRLPNAKELHSIVDYSRSPDTTSSAAIDPVFSCTQITNEGGAADYPFYWSSTTHLGQGGNASDGVYIAFGRALGYMNGSWLDAHGAGAQRSDPKSGTSGTTRGPQGDVIRVYNYVRLVRDIN